MNYFPFGNTIAVAIIGFGLILFDEDVEFDRLKE
jgi:hypothetical protein